MQPLSLAAAVTLDLLIGDPRWLPHPVRWIGRLIALCDKQYYPIKRSAGIELFTGFGLCFYVVGVAAAVGFLFLVACRAVSPWFAVAGEIIIGYYCLSARSLAHEAAIVRKYLDGGDLPEARNAVSMIVGRDTDRLDEKGVMRATIETVAENITDGIVSPLFYLALGGPVAALAFKAVSTMDSMIGYKNERYRHFGTCAARLDDALNFIPARLTAFLLIPLVSFLMRFDWKESLRMTVRDRHKHKSPNSAHGEAAVAGALGIQLGGEAKYQGIVSNKPFLGDPCRNIEIQDIPRTIKILYGVTVLSGGIATAWLWIWNRLFVS